MRRLVLLTLVSLLLSGCAGSAPTDEAPVPPASDVGAPLVPTILGWTGYLRAGGAYEVPGHVEETSAAFQGVWSMSFQLHVDEAPTAMGVQLAWQAPAARLKLMVTEPFDRDPVAWYESAVTDRSPICFAVPPEALRAGVWRIMAHSEIAVDAALGFEVTLEGGAAEVVNEPSHAPAADFPFIVATAETPDPLPCAQS